MKKIIALGGSNSKKSINKIWANYIANLVENVEVTLLDLNDFDLPLYGIDAETENGIPEDAKRLNELLKSADGLVISLAEHNGSYSTAFKNAFDWISRVDDTPTWKNKPMFLSATSPGARGGIGVLEGAKASFPFYGGNIIADFSLPSFFNNFSENELKNDALKSTLMDKVKQFQASL